MPSTSVMPGSKPKDAIASRAQRREGFRVEPLASEPVSCVVRNAINEELHLPVLDFSAVGIAVLWPPQALDLLKPGISWPHCRIEFGLRIALPCELVPKQISEPLKAFGGAVRVGMAYVHLASEAERMLQIAVMDIERKQRALRQAADAAA
jgi:c-di-GMP-binding flagellar brake protein YcgR